MISLAVTMALVRGLHLAAMLSLLGTLGFIAWTLPAASVVPDRLRRRLIRLWWISGLAAVLAGVVWLVIQSAVIAGVDNLSDLLDALPVVAAHTRFGNVVIARLGLLAAAAGLGCFGPVKPGAVKLYLALLLTVIALGLQGMIGHAGATAGAIGDGLVLSEAVHLVAAGIWLGALLPLWLSVRALAPVQGACVCERFSPIGLACVLMLAGTGFAQGLDLIGSLPALLGTTYGHFALVKISLFLLALVLASVNRLWLTDRMAAGAMNARRHLLVSVCFETGVGLAIVGAAAFMASSPPAAHTTPVWPLSWQFSLVTVNEDADFRREVIVSLLAIGLAVVLLSAALLWRRFRLAALGFLLLVACCAGLRCGC